MEIFKKECWVCPHNNRGYVTKKEAVEEQLRFLIHRHDGTVHAVAPERAVMDNAAAVIALLELNCNEN